MLETEFIRSLQSNYERIHLENKPDDQRYQYCILTRGGIKGLLPCSLRYINGEAYLYYDITSRQNVAQLCVRQVLDRKWILDFFQSLKNARQELSRFLLDAGNILVYPDQIFQDVEKRNFYFMYLPYHKGESGIKNLMDFLLEHMDYEDDQLVETVYAMYEQLEKAGESYLQKNIFEDAEKLNRNTAIREITESDDLISEEVQDSYDPGEEEEAEPMTFPLAQQKRERRSLWQRISGRKGKEKKSKAPYETSYYEDDADQPAAYAVAEESGYDEAYGNTVYVEQTVDSQKEHKLYTPDGRVAGTLNAESFLIGKQKDEVDMLLEDESVSRIHARIYMENEIIYLEDLNSTNGTFKNGLRLQPYEKRRLEENDEIRFGKLLFVFR